MFRMISLFIAGLTIPALGQELELKRSVFDLPTMLAQHRRLRLEIQQLIDEVEYNAAADKCQDAIKLFPEDPSNYYILASCQARRGQTEEALLNLGLAIDNGFNDAAHIQQNAFLRPLRKLDGYAELVKRAPNAKPRANPLLAGRVSPSPISDGVAMVSESNTGYQPEINVFESSFKLSGSARLEGNPVTRATDQIGKQVLQWYVRGSGAGLKNHLYDNHDGGHSNLRLGNFPQLNRIEYCDDAKRRRLDHGLQVQFFFNTVTIGNASEAWTGQVYWRSLPRLAYTSPQHMALLNLQYRRNHLYVYPEHNDHDPKNGDVFASNSPYVLISQGSSGSDQQLLEAVAWTLASFQPKTKQKLSEGGALMAAVQMVFRRTNQRVETVEDYLTGKAHPSVFDGSTIDLWRAINLAHRIKPEKVPPVVQLHVIEEDEPRLGIDYFDDHPRVKLFDTPGAVSRLHKSTKENYRMVVSAGQSFDLNDRPLTYHWRVLRGDANNIKIIPLNADHSEVEILVPHQASRPIEPDSDLSSTRVDIGAFVHNGAFYSAPAFVSLYSPRNEIRTYNEQGNIESVEYLPFSQQYEDPVLTTPREWTDRYAYDENHQLTGWTRTRATSVEQFTADGALVIKLDKLGRAARARTVTYQRSNDPPPILPRLEQQLGPDLFDYEYDSPDDRIGKRRMVREPGGEINDQVL
jgi:YD repeat-containing protein